MANETITSTILAINPLPWKNLGITINQLLVNLVIAAVIFFLGIVLGKVIEKILQKIFDKNKLSKKVKYSFIDLFITIVKWSIYILFLDLALIRLQIPALTSWLTSILGMVPAFTASLLLLSAGFGIAAYLKDVILESEIKDGEILATILFYFILYVFAVFAAKTVFFQFEKTFVNNLIIVISGVTATAIIYSHIKNK